MYLLRKSLAPLLFPLPLCLEVLLAGLILLWFSRRQKAARILLTAGILLLAMMSYDPPANALLEALEERYPPLAVMQGLTAGTRDALARVEWIVVLGGGHTPDPRLPATSQIGLASLARLVEGVRLYKQAPAGTRLIVSGGKGFELVPEAEVIASVARILGVPGGDIVIEPDSQDTEDQARRVQALVGQSEFVLVTSASHMWRSMTLFQKYGMYPTPAPSDYDVKRTGTFSPGRFYPQAENVRRVEKAVYEYLGLAWAGLRGGLGNESPRSRVNPDRFLPHEARIGERLGQDVRYWLDCAKAKLELGWSPSSLLIVGCVR